MLRIGNKKIWSRGGYFTIITYISIPLLSNKELRIPLGFENQKKVKYWRKEIYFYWKKMSFRKYDAYIIWLSILCFAISQHLMQLFEMTSHFLNLYIILILLIFYHVTLVKNTTKVKIFFKLQKKICKFI